MKSILLIVLLTFSFVSCKQQELTDGEYIAKYKALHGNMSDESILKIRSDHKKLQAKWDVTNNMLKIATEKRNIRYTRISMQRGTDQILFYNAYYDKNMTVEDFLNEQYPNTKGLQ